MFYIYIYIYLYRLIFLGSTVYTCMLNKRGGVEADLTVSAIEAGNGEVAEPQFEGLL